MKNAQEYIEVIETDRPAGILVDGLVRFMSMGRVQKTSRCWEAAKQVNSFFEM